LIGRLAAATYECGWKDSERYKLCHCDDFAVIPWKEGNPTDEVTRLPADNNLHCELSILGGVGEPLTSSIS